MSSTASVEGDERIRLFLGLRLPENALDALGRWQREAFADVESVRIVPRENIHITLAFLGHRPASELEPIARCLRECAARAIRPVLAAKRYRETRSVGMLVFEDEEGHATAFAEELGEGLERLGVYERERRAWLPHLTVVRFRRRPRLRPAIPDLGRVSPSEAAVYHSVLRRGGAQYEVLESVALGGG